MSDKFYILCGAGTIIKYFRMWQNPDILTQKLAVIALSFYFVLDARCKRGIGLLVFFTGEKFDSDANLILKCLELLLIKLFHFIFHFCYL